MPVTPLRRGRSGRRRLPVLLLAVGIAVLATAETTAPAPAPAAQPCATASPGSRLLVLTSGGLPRSAVVHVPPAARFRAPLPLLLAFHGSGWNGRWMESYTGLSKLADQQGFIVAYPDAYGPQPRWNIGGTGAPDDVGFSRDLIQTLERQGCADPARVFATGVSNGGGMAARLGCDLSDVLKGVAPVAGGYSSLPVCRPVRPVSLLEIHDTGDGVVPYSGRGPTRDGDVLRFVRAWVARDRCQPHAARSVPTYRVVRLDWGHCAGGTAVAHLRVLGGRHEWPGASSRGRGRASPLSASIAVWRFFAGRR